MGSCTPDQLLVVEQQSAESHFKLIALIFMADTAVLCIHIPLFPESNVSASVIAVYLDVIIGKVTAPCDSLALAVAHGDKYFDLLLLEYPLGKLL